VLLSLWCWWWPAGLSPAAAPAAPPAVTSASANAAAMFRVLLARRAEAGDDAKALRPPSPAPSRSTDRRRTAPNSPAYARQNRAAEAVAAAGKALALDASSEEGHRILGLVNAAWADGVVDGPAGGSEDAWRAEAITHLQTVQNSPAMATDLGLQLTLARQLLGADRAADAVPLLERIVSQTGPAGEPVSMLAEALRSLGQLERATTVLEQAAAANPRYFMALGDILERQSKFEEAADAFDRGAKAAHAGRELRLGWRVNALLGIPDGKGAEARRDALTECLSHAEGRPALPAGACHPQCNDTAAAVKAGQQALAIEPRTCRR
jgi:tetratricopeptide (TPR) repeat protein